MLEQQFKLSNPNEVILLYSYQCFTIAEKDVLKPTLTWKRVLVRLFLKFLSFPAVCKSNKYLFLHIILFTLMYLDQGTTKMAKLHVAITKPAQLTIFITITFTTHFACVLPRLIQQLLQQLSIKLHSNSYWNYHHKNDHDFHRDFYYK